VVKRKDDENTVGVLGKEGGSWKSAEGLFWRKRGDGLDRGRKAIVLESA